MNVTEVTDRIKNHPIFKGLELSEPSIENQFGRINVDTRHFKGSDKNEYKLGDYYGLFVAHMYKDTDKEFFYLTFHRRGKRRDFRKHYFYTMEWNSIFVSGNTVDKIISNLESKLIGYELT